MQRNTSERLRPNDVYFFATSHVNLFCSKDEIYAFNLIVREYITVHDVRPGVAPLVGQGEANPDKWYMGQRGPTLLRSPARSHARFYRACFRLATPPDASTTVRLTVNRTPLKPAARLLPDLLSERQLGK